MIKYKDLKSIILISTTMKNIKKIIPAAFLFIFLLLTSLPVLSYDPPPPPPVGGNGDQDPPGGGAPIEGGMAIFIGLATGYGLWKNRKSREEETV